MTSLIARLITWRQVGILSTQPILLPLGGGTMHFLVQHVGVLGVDVQNWMLIGLGLSAAYALFSWSADKRI
jgi:hypothetical protein